MSTSLRVALSGLVLSAIAALPALAVGTAAGQVLSGATGGPIPNVGLAFEGTGVTLTTDLSGVFQGSVPAGTWTVLVTRDGFEAQRVEAAIVDGATETFSVVLMPADGSAEAEGDPAFAEEITVEAAAAEISTEAALLAERKNAVQISDSIGSEEMGKNTGSDAAGVLKRVTGISIQEGKYVYVRGLGDRYSNSTLNGSKIPSTEFEKKVVPLDLFPAALLDRVTVAKSYTVDQPGDFAAGFVDLRTREFPSDANLSIGISASHDSITTGEPILQYGGGLSSTGDGGEPLPASIPADPIVPKSPFRPGGYTPQELEAFGDALVGTWSPDRRGSAPLDQSFKASYGNTFGKLGLLLSGTYENDFDRRDETFAIFALAGGELIPRNAYELEYGTESVRRSALANLAYKFSGNHHVKLRALYTTLAESEGRYQEGFSADIDANLRDYRVSYQDQAVVNLQLGGDHYFPGVFAGGSLLEWRGSSSEATTDENRRETNYQETGDGRYVLTDNAQSGFMYFNDLADTVDDASASWTSFLYRERINGSVKAGVAYTRNARDFDGRRLRFDHRRTFGLDLTLSPEELYTPENIGSGFVLEEITRPTDAYTGDQTIAAGYLQADVAWRRWRVIGGLRYEASDLEVLTTPRTSTTGALVATQLDESDLLPALNVVYALTPAQNLRLGLSGTVNRPEFRELAPFSYTHIVGGFEVVGNPDLVRATIRSYDLRWEWFPSSGEVVAVSAFLKEFDDPIELVQVAAAQRIETYQNADAAENVGFELELRRNLGSLWQPLSAFTGILNATWVDSQIDLVQEGSVSVTNADRALVGQPEEVVNAVLEWSPRWGANVRVLYNRIGDRVSRGGTLGLPDVIEESTSSIDLVWLQSLDPLLEGLSLRLSATNLTDDAREWTQGGEIYRRYEPGRTYGLSLSYSPF